MRPLISICIPTYNRAELLDYCLAGLAPLKDCGKPVEIVISDNGSTDRTPEVIESHRDRLPALRVSRFAENRGPQANWLNALHKAEGEFMAYLADDDSLIVDNLLHHVDTLSRQPDLMAIFADWIAWNDETQTEIHRHYEGLTEFTSFGPTAPIDLINFMLKRFYPPEIGIYRREALVRAHGFHGRTMPYYLRMYRLSRFGGVAFDPLPFYREHRILKDRFQRTHWMNMEFQFQMIGDELRLALESMVLMAVQDSGAAYLSGDQAQVVRKAIDRILHSRLKLEADRACMRKDWIMAVEFKRRLALWQGPGPDAETIQDTFKIVMPAAFQAIQQTFQSLSNVSGISLRGFESGKAAEFFTSHFPDTPIVAPDAHVNGSGPPLIVHRDEATLARDGSITDPGSVMVLEQQLDMYRIVRAKVDLKGF
jgi:glycosyltransferase involved in cell wall biosynthesis